MEPNRLPNADLHYVINAFNRPGDEPGMRIKGNASYYPFDDTALGCFQPGEVELYLSVHVNRNTPKETIVQALQSILMSLDETYETLEEMRSRWINEIDPEDPIILEGDQQ